MPRILRIINRFNLGGPTHNAAYLTRFLPADFETLLVGGGQEATEEGSHHILDAVGVKPLVLPELQREVAPWRDGAAYRRIKQLIREYRPDIVHTHAAKAGAVGRMAAAQLGVKAIVHTFHGHVFHSYFGPLRTALYKNIERYLALRSSRIIAISEQQRAELVNTYRICAADKVSVIPLGFDLSRFREDRERKRSIFRAVYGVAENEVAIGIVGRLVPIKNHDLFLEVIAGLQQRTSKRIRAFIVGDGEERQRLEHLAKGNELANHIIFAGSIEHAELTKFYNACDVFLSFYDYSNAGNPLFEAMMHHCCIVTVDSPAMKYFVSNKAALMLKNTEPKAISEALVSVLKNQSERTEYGDNAAREIHKNMWSWEERITHEVNKIVEMVERPKNG